MNAWRGILHLFRPELVLADHAPTALLAARGLPIARATYGTGFCSPPRTTPLPNMRTWWDIPHERLRASEEHVLKVVNAVLRKYRVSPLGNLAELLHVEEDFLTTYAELDHYQERTGARYWAPVRSMPGQGGQPDWPEGKGRKVFAYLKARSRLFDAVLEQLARLDCRVIVYCGDAPKSVVSKHESETIRFSPRPLDIHAVGEQCDVAVCHAGHGTTSDILLAGKPLLLLPMHLEQYLLAQNVARLGAGVVIDEHAEDEDIPGKCAAVLSEPAYAERAQAFARKYGDSTQEAVVSGIADRLEEILRQRAAGP